MRTELGRIADLIQTVEREPTPLQKRLDQLGHALAAIALVLVAVIFAMGLMRGEDLKTMFLTAVSMAVAAVPEGPARPSSRSRSRWAPSGCSSATR